MDTLQDRIRWILKRRSLSQRGLAARAGLAPSHISLILTGHIEGNVRADTLAAIARGGAVSLEWLSTGTGDPERGAIEPTTAPAALTPGEGDGPLARALVRSLDPEVHELADLDAVRSALAGVSLQEGPGDLGWAARRWLDGAAALRRRGQRVTAGALLAEVTVSTADAERSANANAAGDQAARELGVEPGSAAHLVETLAKSRGRKKS